MRWSKSSRITFKPFITGHDYPFELIDMWSLYSDAMEDNEDETEEEESDKILQEVLDDIGINLSHQVKLPAIRSNCWLAHETEF
jgi:hypothetical protein